VFRTPDHNRLRSTTSQTTDRGLIMTTMVEGLLCPPSIYSGIWEFDCPIHSVSDDHRIRWRAVGGSLPNTGNDYRSNTAIAVERFGGRIVFMSSMPSRGRSTDVCMEIVDERRKVVVVLLAGEG
jgi:hypothetical protein